MEFEHVSLLWIAPLAAAGLLLLHGHAARARARAVAIFHPGSGQLSAMAVARRRATWSVAIAVALMGIALARPLGGFEEGVASREGRDVLVVLDVSLSMYARDHDGSSRAEAARDAVDRLVELLAGDGGHRLSLLAFAGRATLLLPPALDYEAFRTRFDAVGPHDISRRGTRVDTGLAAALGSIETGDEGFTDVVLVSDGEDHGTALRAAGRNLRGTGVAVHVLALGIPHLPTPVLVPGADGIDAPLLYQDEPVRSRADHASMRDLAAFSGGSFCALSQADCIGDVFTAIDGAPKRAFAAEGREQRRRPLYHWLAVPALVLLMGSALGWRAR